MIFSGVQLTSSDAGCHDSEGVGTVHESSCQIKLNEDSYGSFKMKILLIYDSLECDPILQMQGHIYRMKWTTVHNSLQYTAKRS